MIETVGGQQSFRWKLFEGPQLKGNSRGGPGFPAPKKMVRKKPGVGHVIPFFWREGCLDRKHVLNFESQFLKRSMEKIEKKTNYILFQTSHKMFAQFETSVISC